MAQWGRGWKEGISGLHHKGIVWELLGSGSEGGQAGDRKGDNRGAAKGISGA